MDQNRKRWTRSQGQYKHDNRRTNTKKKRWKTKKHYTLTKKHHTLTKKDDNIEEEREKERKKRDNQGLTEKITDFGKGTPARAKIR